MMDMKAAMEMLEESQGSNVNNIYVPTFGKELPFKPLTTGQQKSISKFALDMDESYNIDEEFLKLALFDSLSIDKSYKSDKLKEVDILAFYAGVRQLNIIAPLILTVTCDNKGCEKEFKLNVDLDDIINKCKKFKSKEIEFEKIVGETTYKFILSEPLFKDLVEFEQYIKMVVEQDIVGNINDFRLFTTPVLFIKSVYINGEILADFKDAGFIEKLNFYEKLKGDVTISPSTEEGNDSLLLQVLEHFSTEEEKELFDEIKCPHCQKEVEGVITYDNFFII